MVAATSGADAIGTVVDAPSPRAVNATLAREILTVAWDLDRVVVMLPRNVEKAVQIAKTACPTILQLHGREEPMFLVSLREALDAEGLAETRIIKSIGIGPDSDREDLLQTCKSYAKSTDGLLFDTNTTGTPGGTGKVHDWQVSRWIRDRLGETRVILAGGLNPSNVARAILAVKPFGVDVSTGVELKPGKKNPEMISAFIEAVRRTEP